MELQTEFNQNIARLVSNSKDIEAFDLAIKAIVGSHVLHAGRMRKSLSKATELTLGEILNCEKTLRAIPATHSHIALNFIQRFGEISPVGVNGFLWMYDHKNGLWEASNLKKVAAEIGQIYSSHSRSVKLGDYTSLSNLVYDEVYDENFFTSATKGINTPKGFYAIENKELICRKTCVSDKARYKLNISPDANCEITEFIKMLQFAFGDTFEYQIKQLQMIFGLALIGLQPSLQRACLLMGAGGSGKSTIIRLLEALVPEEFVARISPLELDCDYKKAALADKLLNLVPEIDKDKVIPSAAFKAVTGEDKISARQPFGRVFNFVSNAGNWFSGNFFITTKDHSDAFYRRWVIIRFYHAKLETERDPMLTDRIIKNELPGILAWAFDGVRDYLKNGLYLSTIHYSAMKEWKTDGNSALSWLNDEENGMYRRAERDGRAPIPRTRAYKKYVSWCLSSNKKPFSKKVFYMFIEEKGIIASKYNGYDCYFGLTIEPPTIHNESDDIIVPF